jgi:RimJ/RimL family protein N-acetyltransferase
VQLRDVEIGDLDIYVRLRCDPATMAELGGPLPREGIEEKVRRDAREAAADIAWIKMIIADESVPERVAGTVTLWSHEPEAGSPISEIGWMVLPEFQGRGLAKHATRALLERARDESRWESCTRSLAPRTPPRTVSAAPSGSASSANRTRHSPAGYCAPTTG